VLLAGNCKQRVCVFTNSSFNMLFAEASRCRWVLMSMDGMTKTEGMGLLVEPMGGMPMIGGVGLLKSMCGITKIGGVWLGLSMLGRFRGAVMVISAGKSTT
jgi:hypothetical protein